MVLKKDNKIRFARRKTCCVENELESHVGRRHNLS